jgi:hypothetical protein
VRDERPGNGAHDIKGEATRVHAIEQRGVAAEEPGAMRFPRLGYYNIADAIRGGPAESGCD